MSRKHPVANAPQRRAVARSGGDTAAHASPPAEPQHAAVFDAPEPESEPAAALQTMTAIEHVLASPAATIPIEPQGTETMNDTMTDAVNNAVNDTANGTMHADPANSAPNFARNAADSAVKQAEGVAADMKAKATQFAASYNEQTKDAMTKGSKVVEELVAMQKGNMEALAESARIAAKGAQDLARHATDVARKAIEESNETVRKLATVKSPTEFMTMQGDAAKAQLDSAVAEMSRFTESYVKLIGDMFQPLQNRYAVTMDKVRSTNA